MVSGFKQCRNKTQQMVDVMNEAELADFIFVHVVFMLCTAHPDYQNILLLLCIVDKLFIVGLIFELDELESY